MIPVETTDRFFLLFEGSGPPVSCIWALTFDTATLDRERFVAAVGQAMRRYPKAASRLSGGQAPFGPKPHWIPFDDAARQACFFHEPHELPARDAAVSAHVRKLLNTPLDIRYGSPLHLHWFPSGPSRSLVLMHFHHALTDGFGSLVFLKAVLDGYRGAEDVAPATVRETRGRSSAGASLPKLQAVGRLIAHSFRQMRRNGFIAPEKLFDREAVISGDIGIQWRELPSALLDRCRRMARTAGVSSSSLLVAAQAAAITAWKRERGKTCRMLRLMLNVNLARHDMPSSLGHSSSALHIWFGSAELADPRQLPRLVQRQVTISARNRLAEAVHSLSILMALPAWVVRPLVLGPIRSGRGTDSLVMTNMGDLSLPGCLGESWLRLGDGRLQSAYGFARPIEGVGATVIMIECAEKLQLCLSYLSGLIAPEEGSRLLELTEAALDQLCEA